MIASHFMRLYLNELDELVDADVVAQKIADSRLELVGKLAAELATSANHTTVYQRHQPRKFELSAVIKPY